MTISRLLLLQKSANFLLKDASFSNRWVTLNSLHKGLELRYNFNSTYPLTKIGLSRALGKMEPMIENIKDAHESGLYRATIGNKLFYYQQDPKMKPPSVPKDDASYSKKGSSSHLETLIKDDADFLDNFCNRILRERNMCRTTKRKRDYTDEVDEILTKAEDKINLSLLKKTICNK